MDDGLIIVLDYEKICRLCLQTKGVLSDIFDKDDEEPLAVQIKLVTSVEISESDSLPKKICHKCRYIVELCCELRTTVLKSSQLLSESADIDVEKISQFLEKNLQHGDYVDTKTLGLTLSEQEVKEEALENQLELGEGSGEQPGAAVVTQECMEVGVVLAAEAEGGPNVEYDLVGDFLAKDEDSSGVPTPSDNVLTLSNGVERWQVAVLPDGEGEGQGEAQGLIISRERASPLGPEPPPEPEDSSEWKGYNTKKRKRGSSMEDKLMCQLCLENSETEEDLLEHVLAHYSSMPELLPYHTISKPFNCAPCGDQTFSSHKDLVVHHRAHLNINPYKCTEKNCDSYVKSRDALRHHMYSHAEKKFVCEVCGSAFRRKFELGQHRVRHQDEGMCYSCNICRVVCKNRLSFKAHMRHHETGRRFKCTKQGCPKAFFSKTDLTIHERSHSNNKCYKCPLCVCAYISQSQLNRHLKQHEKRRVNKCDKCSESFADYAEFCNHRIKTHGEWHPHKCPACNQGYQNMRALDRHMVQCQLALQVDDRTLVDISEMGTIEVPILNEDEPLQNSEAEDGMIIDGSELQLSTDENMVDGENFLFISAAASQDEEEAEAAQPGEAGGQEGEEEAEPGAEPGGESHYMLINDEPSVAVKHFTCKVLMS